MDLLVCYYLHITAIIIIVVVVVDDIEMNTEETTIQNDNQFESFTPNIGYCIKASDNGHDYSVAIILYQNH